MFAEGLAHARQLFEIAAAVAGQGVEIAGQMQALLVAGNQQMAVLIDLMAHFGHGLGDGADHLGDVAGRLAGGQGKVAHFVGNHGKAAALLAGTGRLDGGIQRQQLGLLGQALDAADGFLDGGGAAEQFTDRAAGAAQALFDIEECAAHFVGILAAVFTSLVRLAERLHGVLGMLADLQQGLTDLFAGRRDHRDPLALLAGLGLGVLGHLLQRLAGELHLAAQALGHALLLAATHQQCFALGRTGQAFTEQGECVLQGAQMALPALLQRRQQIQRQAQQGHGSSRLLPPGQ